MRQRHEDDLFDQRAPQSARRLFDENGAVIERDDLHARRQAWLDLSDARLHRIDHDLGIDARACDDHTADRLARAPDQRCDTKRVADLDVGDLLDVDRCAIRGAHDNLLDVVHRGDQADASHDQPGAVGLQDVAPDIDVALTHGGHDRAQRHFVLAQAIRIDVDLVLLDEAADGCHLGHARDRIELIAHEPVLERPQFSKGQRGTFEGVPKHVTDTGGVGSERRDHTGRERFRDEAHPLEHPCSREVQIDGLLKDRVDH